LGEQGRPFIRARAMPASRQAHGRTAAARGRLGRRVNFVGRSRQFLAGMGSPWRARCSRRHPGLPAPSAQHRCRAARSCPAWRIPRRGGRCLSWKSGCGAVRFVRTPLESHFSAMARSQVSLFLPISWSSLAGPTLLEDLYLHNVGMIEPRKADVGLSLRCAVECFACWTVTMGLRCCCTLTFLSLQNLSGAIHSWHRILLLWPVLRKSMCP
jgi:hypothetical protein